MATRQREGIRGHRERRWSFGTFKLGGTDQRTRLHITRDLDKIDFPSSPGEELEVVMVEPEDGEIRVELYDASENGEE